jgi:arylesterase/paraoxonase
LTENFHKPFAPHGISIYSKNNETTLAAVNHTINGEFIEIFKLKDLKLTHIKTLENELVSTPNDIVLLDHETFYLTNDHKFKTGFMRMIEDYIGLSVSNIIFYDGKKFVEAAKGISYANGINYDKNRSLLFVASPRKFEIKIYKKETDNSLTFIENIYCGTGVDNIEFDLKNNLWIGAHPNLLHFNSYAFGYNNISPSEIIKLQYFGKEDYKLETVYLENGEEMSGSTVAAPFGNLILMGNVMDDHFLILKKY